MLSLIQPCAAQPILHPSVFFLAPPFPTRVAPLPRPNAHLSAPITPSKHSHTSHSLQLFHSSCFRSILSPHHFRFSFPSTVYPALFPSANPFSHHFPVISIQFSIFPVMSPQPQSLFLPALSLQPFLFPALFPNLSMFPQCFFRCLASPSDRPRTLSPFIA